MTVNFFELGGPDEKRRVDVAAISEAGNLRLRERQSLSSCDRTENRGDSRLDRLERYGETVLSVFQGG